MIHFVVALLPEAKPVLDYYGLRAAGDSGPFRWFEKGSIRLVISGVGKVRSADAVRFLAGRTAAGRNHGWINVGIAGHADRVSGEGILAHKVIDDITRETWYPPMVFQAPCETDTVRTVGRAEKQFRGRSAYDMEASGFYRAAQRFSTLELVPCFKVISDNRVFSHKQVTPRLAQNLIEKNLAALTQIAKDTSELSDQLRKLELPESELQKWTERWHFTVTEKHQLRRLLRRLKTLQPGASFFSHGAERLRGSSQVLNHLARAVQSGVQG